MIAPAARLGHHLLAGVLAADEDAVEVDLDHGVPAVDRDVLDLGPERRAGVVDHDVEAAELRHRAVDDGLDLVFLADVDGHREGAAAEVATSLATASQFSSLRLHTATSAPARANSSAMDLPMPTPPPVTMAVLPSMENGFFAMPATIAQPPASRLGHRSPGQSGSALGPSAGQRGRAMASCRRGTSRSIRLHTASGEKLVPLSAAQVWSFSSAPRASSRRRRAPWRRGARRRRPPAWPRSTPARRARPAGSPGPPRRRSTAATRPGRRSGGSRSSPRPRSAG